MDRKFLKQVRRVLLLESFYTGTSSLSKALEETEEELEELIELIDKKTKRNGLIDSKILKKW